MAGLISRLLTSATATTSVTEPVENRTEWAHLPSHNFRKVVGESHYQGALEAVEPTCVAGPDERRMFQVFVVPEPDNPYDPDAIAVHSGFGKVGYLSRDDAQCYKATFDELGRRGYYGATCWAYLNGGEPGRPSFGVVLALGYPEACEQHLGLG